MNVLFVCSANQLRSPTVAAVFAGEPGLETRSAGTDAFSAQSLSAELVGWADRIFVMEAVHEEILRRRFGGQLGGKPVVVLDIPDRYAYMQPELVTLPKERVSPLLT